MSISKIKESARTALAGKWGKGVCIILAYLAFSILMGFIVGIAQGIFGEDSIVASLLDIATSIVQVPIAFGLTFVFIKLKRNEEVKAFDFIDIGFSNFGRAWKISLRVLLKMILPIIGIIVSIIILGLAIFNAAATAVAGTSMLSFTGLMGAGLIVYIASLIWLVVVSLLYSLTTVIAYDNPNMKSLEIVNESAKMMRGNRGKIFLLDLSFIGWAILTVFTLGIGYLWLLPYMEVALICFYEYLLGKNENNNPESNVDAITEM